MAGSIAILSALGLSAGLAGAAGAGLRAIMRRKPARSTRFETPRKAGLAAALPFRPLGPASFVTSQDQGGFGEALTMLVMAAHGWRTVNGKVSGPKGIDGIFVRDSAAGLEAVLVETKTGSSAYSERQMRDEKLLGDLDMLYLTAPDAAHQAVYAAIAEGLESGAPGIAKELWRHSLDTGRTQIVALGGGGERLSKGRLMDTRVMCEALAAAARELDRANAYVEAP